MKTDSALFVNLFSLSQTQRRLAHDCKRRAIKWRDRGCIDFYERNKAEANRLWRDAKWHLQHARMNRHG